MPSDAVTAVESAVVADPRVVPAEPQLVGMMVVVVRSSRTLISSVMGRSEAGDVERSGGWYSGGASSSSSSSPVGDEVDFILLARLCCAIIVTVRPINYRPKKCLTTNQRQRVLVRIEPIHWSRRHFILFGRFAMRQLGGQQRQTGRRNDVVSVVMLDGVVVVDVVDGVAVAVMMMIAVVDAVVVIGVGMVGGVLCARQTFGVAVGA